MWHNSVSVNDKFTAANLPSFTTADDGSTAELLGTSAVGGEPAPASTLGSSEVALFFSTSAAGACATAAVASNTAGFIPNGSTEPAVTAGSVDDTAACGWDLDPTDAGGCIAGTFVTPAGGLDVGLGSDAGCFSAGDSDAAAFSCFLYDGGTTSGGRLAGTGLPDLAMAT